VQAAIGQALKARERRTEITQDRVLRELAKLAYSDMRAFASWGPDGVKLVESDRLSDDDAACVAEVSEATTKDGGSLKFKLHDKRGALELLGKHLGMFIERFELSGNLEIVVKLPEDLADRPGGPDDGQG